MEQQKGFSRKRLLAILLAVLAVGLSGLLIFNLGFPWGASESIINNDGVPLSDGQDEEALEGEEEPLEDGEAEEAEPSDEPSEEQAPEEETPADEPIDVEAVAEAEAAAEERATGIEELGYIPDEIVVVYEDSATTGEQGDIADLVGAEEVSEAVPSESGDVVLMDISDDITVDTAVEMAQEDDAVKFAFPNFIAESFDNPAAGTEAVGASPLATGDEFSDDEWYLSAMNTFGAWSALASAGITTNPVGVAVLDTGAFINHPDLTNIIDKKASVEIYWKDGKAYSRALKGDGYMGGNDIPLHSTHGTHVSGIIAAEAKNGGVLGVASGGATSVANKLVRLVAIDVFAHFNDAGEPTATANDVLLGLTQAKSANCSVVNMSLGFYTQNTPAFAKFVETLNGKVDELTNAGIVVVCAAGNNNTSTECYPAACNSAISVISVSKRDAIASSSTTYKRKTWETNGYMRSYFSNYGPWCDIAAPGERICSTVVLSDKVSGGYDYLDGTSMASPMVAGTVAMMKAANPGLSANEIRNLLFQTATDLNTSGKDNESGFGLVNAEAAVKSALSAAGASRARSVETHNSDPEPPANIASAAVSVSNQTYTGNLCSASPIVKFQGVTLQQNRDYKVTISPATVKNAGTYTVTVQGIGMYTGSAKGTFKVEPANISSAQVSSMGSMGYTGGSLKPQPKVTLQGKTLVNGTDYTLSYSNNVNVGTATVTITGKGNYTGAKKATFSIVGTAKATSPTSITRTAAAISTAPKASLAYTCHVQNIGWQTAVHDGSLSGTSGRSLRVEALRAYLVNQPYSGDIRVRASVQNVGWQNWVMGSAMAKGKALAGTSGRSLRVEALMIELTGEMAKRYDVYYRTHVQNIGWTGWAKNGAKCGSAGYGYRMEALQIKLVAKGSPAPGVTTGTYAHPLVSYQTHVQNIGWQSPAFDGAIGGTSGRSLRVEAFRVSLVDQPYPGGIEVSSHVQNIGWQGWMKNGATSGTSGRALRVEALKIRLTGEMANRYDVYYRTHCQNIGWTGWAKNGASSGSAGYAYRMEAVQIKLVPKGGAAPGPTVRPFYQR